MGFLLKTNSTYLMGTGSSPLPPLPAPEFIRDENEVTFTWNAVPGATQYKVEHNEVVHYYSEPQTYQLSSWTDSYIITAIGEGYSDSTATFTYNPVHTLDEPIITVSGNTVSWEPVDGAVKYRYSVGKNGEAQWFRYTHDTSVDIDNLWDNDTVNICAICWENSREKYYYLNED